MKRFYKVGDLIQMSNDQYSDYCIGPVMRVTKEFDLKEVVKSLNITKDEFKEYPCGSTDIVRERIMEAGSLEEVPCEELWLGAYGRFYDWDFGEE